MERKTRPLFHTATGVLADANAGDGKDVTVTVTLANDNHTLAQNTASTTVKIIKAPASTMAVYEDESHIGAAATNSITVKKYPITVKAKDQSIYVGGTMRYALGTDDGVAPADGQFSETIPNGKDVGDYIVWYKVKGDDSHEDTDPLKVVSTITKAQSTVTEAPQATNPTCNGTPQELVTPGKAEGGTMQYSLDGKTWSKEIPIGTDAKEYVVWYRVIGDADHRDSGIDSVTATIEPSASPRGSSRLP